MKILILEDEIPAYQKLTKCLDAFFDVKISQDWARSIVDGKTLLAENSYDFILSDIQLLDGLSFDLFNAVKIETPIIFCSAHDDYLFQAFNTNGIAYILKPYSQNDFDKAIQKYQALFKKGDYNTLNSSTIDALKSALQEENTTYKKRFVIKKAKGIQLLNAIDISLITASGDFCLVNDAEGKRHTISQNLGTIHQQLNPKKFFKINRSEIVNIDFIENIESHFKNRLLISIKNHKEKVMTSSSTTSDFRKWLEN
ncbi:LytR/AlgR family response regulator transcription factor [Polaribacter dokdonensis]|uniref:Two component transcriptional regulator, LytTR family n=1 Tax=Polaribacter dokdonensis DSW-5 TaxID=1300348 RepID=A0A0M9CFP5_9FLAO|nr:LytTR family DNA-binding domain-containing protein [Polaribacter dokdonensis]KOY51219.1 Two-component system response regulator containing LytTR DNA-binding domain [Polaribacter dokdonensis DSW-5]SEE16186.1 two component transcriptional regulator, LytTR family [Polaribacter dokdonensis DSW-5]